MPANRALRHSLILATATAAPALLSATSTTIERLTARSTVLGVAGPEVVFVAESDDRLRFMASAGTAATTRSLFEVEDICTRHCSTVSFHPVDDVWYFVFDDEGRSQSEVLAFDSAGGTPPVVVIDETRDGFRTFGSFAPVGANGHSYFLVERSVSFDGFAIVEVDPARGLPVLVLSIDALFARPLGIVGSRWILDVGSGLSAFDLESGALEPFFSFADRYVNLTPLINGMNGLTFFATRELGPPASFSSELWTTDGTVAGTIPSFCCWEHPDFLLPSLRIRGGDEEPVDFLLVERAPNVTDIVMSDGSAAQTRWLGARPRSYAGASGLVRFRGDYYFLASPAHEPEAHGSTLELWRSDGTEAGTVTIAAIPSPPPVVSAPGVQPEVVALEDRLIFSGPSGQEGSGTELWRSDGSAAGTALFLDLVPGDESSFPYRLSRLGDRVVFSATTAATGGELWIADQGGQARLLGDLLPGELGSGASVVSRTDDVLFASGETGFLGIRGSETDPCHANGRNLCLAGGRFRLSAAWRDLAGRVGAASAEPLTGESGYFWFFDSERPELFTKILDACGLPDFRSFWSFSAGLTNLATDLVVVDTNSGLRKRFRTRPGEVFLPILDTAGFPTCDTASPSSAIAPAPPGGETNAPHAALSGAESSGLSGGGCDPTGDTLCLLGGRFEVRATFSNGIGEPVPAQAVSLGDSSAFFWFFGPENVEIFVKMIDGCSEPGFHNHWFFAGGLTDRHVVLFVRDTVTDELFTVDSPLGTPFLPILETSRFGLCIGS